MSNSLPVFFGPASTVVTANNPITSPATPFTILSNQVKVSEKANLIELHGTSQYALAVAGGKKSIDVEITAATYDFEALGAAYFNQVPVTSLVPLAYRQYATADQPYVIATGTITYVVPNSGTWAVDQGVVWATGPNAGLPAGKATSSPAVGQYSVSAGTYAFNATDDTNSVNINYDYTTTATGAGQVITRINQLLGVTANCTVALTGINPITNKLGLLTLPNVVFASLDITEADLEKFWMPKLTGKAFVNVANVPYVWSIPNVG
jgi:hypothetical protein